jgi:CheY-like chemotaxis protein
MARSTKPSYRHFTSPSAAELQALPGSIPMLAQGDHAAADQNSGPVVPRRSRQRRARRPRGRGSQVTILVVDDEEPVRETLVEVLRIHRYRVITAASVAEAEDAKERLGADGIHLVITDVHLAPGRQVRAGYVLAQRWRAERPALPIILISGDPSNQDLPEVRAGALGFLLKPFSMEALLDAVRGALGG